MDFKKLNLQYYVAHTNFDNKGYAQTHLRLRPGLSHIPQLEDFWEDCYDEFEVKKRMWSRFMVNQIVTM